MLQSCTMNDLVIKSNRLIEAQYKLNLTESRLILKLVSIIEKDDQDFKPYRFKVYRLLNEFNMDEDDYNHIKEATKSLLKRVMLIRDLETGDELQVSFLSSALYKKEGTVEICFDPKLKPYLLQLKENFTAYRLENVKRFKRVYAIRFYELLKQYQKIGKRKFRLFELRKILGISDNEYKQYTDFKKRVMLPAQEELNLKSDISFEFKETRRGKRVEEIEFAIHANKIDYKTLDRKITLRKQAKKLQNKIPKKQAPQ